MTHDQAEALSLGDKVCVMNEGEILQVGPPSDMYSRPANLFVAQFVGEMNFVRGKIAGDGQADSPLGRLQCPVPPGCEAGKEVTLAIRPEHLTLQAQSDKDSQCVEGTITSKTFSFTPYREVRTFIPYGCGWGCDRTGFIPAPTHGAFCGTG